ncbi:hypothetical protein [Mycetocola saprophilus]|uniref:hypothetical protein n=1 Tax=Mycetocola saprophilus TaxID=76636 RepID=UPI0004BEC267|nr:hypothetical protein [Mycetocola saprophilus]
MTEYRMIGRVPGTHRVLKFPIVVFGVDLVLAIVGILAGHNPAVRWGIAGMVTLCCLLVLVFNGLYLTRRSLIVVGSFLVRRMPRGSIQRIRVLDSRGGVLLAVESDAWTGLRRVTASSVESAFREIRGWIDAESGELGGRNPEASATTKRYLRRSITLLSDAIGDTLQLSEITAPVLAYAWEIGVVSRQDALNLASDLYGTGLIDGDPAMFALVEMWGSERTEFEDWVRTNRPESGERDKTRALVVGSILRYIDEHWKEFQLPWSCVEMLLSSDADYLERHGPPICVYEEVPEWSSDDPYGFWHDGSRHIPLQSARARYALAMYAADLRPHEFTHTFVAALTERVQNEWPGAVTLEVSEMAGAPDEPMRGMWIDSVNDNGLKIHVFGHDNMLMVSAKPGFGWNSSEDTESFAPSDVLEDTWKVLLDLGNLGLVEGVTLPFFTTRVSPPSGELAFWPEPLPAWRVRVTVPPFSESSVSPHTPSRKTVDP